MIKKLFMTIMISAGTLSCLFAQTSSENNNKVVVKDENPHKVNDQPVQYKAITNKKQYYLEHRNLNQDLRVKKVGKKNPPVKNENSEIKDENDDL